MPTSVTKLRVLLHGVQAGTTILQIPRGAKGGKRMARGYRDMAVAFVFAFAFATESEGSGDPRVI
jgi:hypothetical protein